MTFLFNRYNYAKSMLKLHDKIEYIKHDEVIAIDEVVKISGFIAITKFGKKFTINTAVLFPLHGHRYGYKFRKNQDEK